MKLALTEATQSLRLRCRVRWLLERLAWLESRVDAPLRFDVETLQRQLKIDDDAGSVTVN